MAVEPTNTSNDDETQARELLAWLQDGYSITIAAYVTHVPQKLARIMCIQFMRGGYL